jgi:hypothetical protein
MVTNANRKPAEPLRPVEARPVTREISLIDSFEKLIDRLLRNFQSLDRPKAEEFRSLTIVVVLDPEERTSF